jgi:xanthine dehydrogenase accessory factor
MDDWIDFLLECRRDAQASVLVTVASVRGSVPRDPGTRMVVTATRQHGTIGGGHLELQAAGIARDLLAGGSVGALRRFPLGASLGQCCGGLVNLMFEAVAPCAWQAAWLDEVHRHRAADRACMLVSGAGRPSAAGSLVVTASSCSGTLGEPGTDEAARALSVQMLAAGAPTRLAALAPDGPLFLFDPLRAPEARVFLFGAGHVGQALARLLGGLACRVTWIDEREDLFPARLAGNTRVEVSDAPVAEVDAAPAGSLFLVMTHSHPLDQALAEAILRRDDFRYFGLIGSLAKRRQFERRLAARGVAADALARMVCPIGIAGIDSKEPAAIAVAVAAQLLRMLGRQATAAPPAVAPGVAPEPLKLQARAHR